MSSRVRIGTPRRSRTAAAARRAMSISRTTPTFVASAGQRALCQTPRPHLSHAITLSLLTSLAASLDGKLPCSKPLADAVGDHLRGDLPCFISDLRRSSKEGPGCGTRRPDSDRGGDPFPATRTRVCGFRCNAKPRPMRLRAREKLPQLRGWQRCLRQCCRPATVLTCACRPCVRQPWRDWLQHCPCSSGCRPYGVRCKKGGHFPSPDRS